MSNRTDQLENGWEKQQVMNETWMSFILKVHEQTSIRSGLVRWWCFVTDKPLSHEKGLIEEVLYHTTQTVTWLGTLLMYFRFITFGGYIKDFRPGWRYVLRNRVHKEIDIPVRKKVESRIIRRYAKVGLSSCAFHFWAYMVAHNLNIYSMES